MTKVRVRALLALAAVSICAPSIAGAAAPGQCFNARSWSGWTVSPDAKAMYIRTGVRDVYRVQFSGTCEAARGIGAHVVTRIRGSSWICGPLDLDLSFSEGRGPAIPCIVSDIKPLTADEASALPRGLKP